MYRSRARPGRGQSQLVLGHHWQSDFLCHFELLYCEEGVWNRLDRNVVFFELGMGWAFAGLDMAFVVTQISLWGAFVG